MAYSTAVSPGLSKEETVLGRTTIRLPPALVAGAAILGILLGLAICAPLLAGHNPIQQDPTQALLPPSSRHLLGTDQLGRDVWSRLLYGGRIDFQVGFLAVLFPFCIGSAIGLMAGYFGGWVDAVAMRAVDVTLAFPFFVLVIAL